MKKVIEFLQQNPVQYLATVGRDGKAKCRPFMFVLAKDNKLPIAVTNMNEKGNLLRIVQGDYSKCSIVK